MSIDVGRGGTHVEPIEQLSIDVQLEDQLKAVPALFRVKPVAVSCRFLA